MPRWCRSDRRGGARSRGGLREGGRVDHDDERRHDERARCEPDGHGDPPVDGGGRAAHISPHRSPERKGGRHSGLSALAPKPQERLGWGTTTSLPAAVHSPGAVIFNGTVYVAGGSGSGNAPVATVYRAVIQSDGMLGTIGLY